MITRLSSLIAAHRPSLIATDACKLAHRPATNVVAACCLLLSVATAAAAAATMTDDRPRRMPPNATLDERLSAASTPHVGFVRTLGETVIRTCDALRHRDTPQYPRDQKMLRACTIPTLCESNDEFHRPRRQGEFTKYMQEAILKKVDLAQTGHA